MGCYSIPGLPSSIKFASTYLYTWVERYHESQVSCPAGTQHNVLGQDLNLEHLLQSRACLPWGHCTSTVFLEHKLKKACKCDTLMWAALSELLLTTVNKPNRLHYEMSPKESETTHDRCFSYKISKVPIFIQTFIDYLFS